MRSLTRQYLFGLIFIGIGVYQLVVQDYLESGLYGIAGLAFIFNALTFEPKLVVYKKSLVVISWMLIGTTVLLFFYLLQFKQIKFF
jgi:hypothetical protein